MLLYISDKNTSVKLSSYVFGDNLYQLEFILYFDKNNR